MVPRSYSFYRTVGGTGTRTTRNFLLRVRKQKRDEHGASFQSSPNYRKWSIKRRGSYCLFPVKGAALIQEWRLIESDAYFNYRYNTEGNIKPRIKWGAYYIHFNIYFFNVIECFHSRGQHLCKFIGTKESVCIRKEFNSHRTRLGHQHGRSFIVLGHQYGRLDVMWKNTLHELWLLRLNYVRYKCGAYSSSGA